MARWIRRDWIWAGVLLLMLVGVASTWYRLGVLPALGVVLVCVLWSATVGRRIR